MGREKASFSKGRVLHAQLKVQRGLGEETKFIYIFFQVPSLCTERTDKHIKYCSTKSWPGKMFFSCHFSQCLRFWDIKSLNIIDNVVFFGRYLMSDPCQVMNKDSLIYIFISYILQENSSPASPMVHNLHWLARTFKISPCHQFSFYTGHSERCA